MSRDFCSEWFILLFILTIYGLVSSVDGNGYRKPPYNSNSADFGGGFETHPGPVVEGLKLKEVLVPPYKLVGESARLECPFDLGHDRLYVVKWYKDNEEFFSFVPRRKPHIRTHDVDGVNLKASESDMHRVYLTKLDIRSTGVYRCEVSLEGPSFMSRSAEARMTIVYIPEGSPKISVSAVPEELAEVESGEILDLNCTSQKSFPPAVLTWYVNELPVNRELVSHHGVFSPPIFSPISSVSQLKLPLTPEHFGPDGNVRIKCVASISTLSWQDGDEKIVINTHHHKKFQQVTHTPDFDLWQGRSNSNSNLAPADHAPSVEKSFEDRREALLLVRGSSPKVRANLLVLFIITLFAILR